MTKSTIAGIGIICIAISMLSGCANTIRGMGQDTANTVNATQSAGRSVEKAAQ
ncbi:entericidin B [Mycoplana sp. BE70]|uniref:entericidin domain-containing protein n=1 Tax=Mycoplana sp. BE70 TaxID=2817775 RepID=UPI002866DA55|nr:entericidin [Mycoplana sp. BE70]MDR6756797.1 entericidin B [Mycoplana sp. BE70]